MTRELAEHKDSATRPRANMPTEDRLAPGNMKERNRRETEARTRGSPGNQQVRDRGHWQRAQGNASQEVDGARVSPPTGSRQQCDFGEPQ